MSNNKKFDVADNIIIHEGILKGIEESVREKALILIDLLSAPISLKIPINQIKEMN